MTFLHDYHFTPEVIPAPKRAFKRYLLRTMIIPIIIVIVSFIFFLPWGYLSLILLVLSFLWGNLKYKDAGWNIEDQQLTLTYRGLMKITVFMKKSKIQSLSIRKSYFQDKRSLATVDAIIKTGAGSSGGRVVDLEAPDILKIYQWYHYS